MAAVLQLIRKEDYKATDTTINLRGGTDGVDLDYMDGYRPKVAPRKSDGDLDEVINLIISGTTTDNLAANLQGLDAKIKEAVEWADLAETQAVWLRCSLTNETGTRQALVREVAGAIGESVFGPFTDAQSVMRRYTLGLIRSPWWESTTDGDTRSLSFATAFGSVASYVATEVVGDMPARIGRMDLQGSATGGGPLVEFWLGARTDRWGDSSNFQPIWDWGDADATMGVQTTRTNTGAAVVHGAWEAVVAYQGTADDEDNVRVTATVDDFTPDYTDQRGEYIVLLRARVTAGEWRVRLQDGLEGSDDDTWRTQDRVRITSTSYLLHELGTVVLPAHKISDAALLQKYAMRIRAEVASGAGNLHLDACVLIPRGEGAIHVLVKGTGVQYSGGDLDPCIVRTHPNGDVEGIWYDDTIPQASAEVHPFSWGLPATDTGILVVAAQRAASHVLTDDFDADLYLWPRWRTLRGAE
jgi:hypothetical protein